MKHLRTLLALSLLLAACSTKVSRVDLVDWQFLYAGKWHPASVPGFIHTDLMSAGLLPDPYYATNEDSVQWVSDSVWHYRCLINPEAMPQGPKQVVFEGLAGRVLIEGLGDTIYSCDNMFTRHTFPLPDTCTAIRLHFIPLGDSLAEAEYGIPLPDRRAFTRIAPYQQGWDWGPRLLTCGIWKKVYVVNDNEHLCEYNYKGENHKVCQDNVPFFRSVQFRQEADSIGQSFAFYSNGKPLFVKGANWIPLHTFPSMTPQLAQRYRMLLCAAKDANYNMLRVWGGGIYEHDLFFHLCDSLGIMVWMDFNFSCALYPDNDRFLASVDREARENITRIARHPCVVLWCGNNEVKNGWEDWGWPALYKWTPAQQARLRHAIDTLFADAHNGKPGILARAVLDCDPQRRPYIASSPLFGWGHPECVTHGDSHYWGVWWGEEPFEMYRVKTGRFMSEYGFQSYPLIGTIRQYAPERELAVDSPSLRSHQKHPRGLQIIDQAMRRYYGFDSRSLPLPQYAYVSQLLQAWGVGYGILSHLTNTRCAGTLYWQLNDSWPVASWSSVDYYGNWKALHYRAQALFADTADLARWQRYYAIYPKQRTYPRPDYTVRGDVRNGQLVVTLIANSDLYDVCLQPKPFVNGHFDRNFINLQKGDSVTLRFIPASSASPVPRDVDVITLNHIYSGAY